MKKNINILGKSVEVISQVDAEDVDLYACCNISYFSDDVHTVCDICGTDIVHRPSAPLLPKKVCLKCALSKVEEEEEKGDDVNVCVSEASAAELKKSGIAK